MASLRPRLSILEGVDLIFRLLFVVPTQLPVNIIRAVVLSRLRGLPLRFYLHCAVVRVFLSRFYARQLQFLQPTFPQTYKKFITARRVQATKTNDVSALARLNHDYERLDNGAAIGWLGDRAKATKFVLFFHGGGYVAPIQDDHLAWCWNAYVNVHRGGHSAAQEVAVAVLQYTLVPAATYPTQLLQAATALRYLVETRGIRPDDLVIGGDSAGANLTAQVLSHLLHPRPGITPVNMGAPLAGAFLVSPWVTTSTEQRSYVNNRWIDMLSPEMMRDVSARTFGSRECKYEITAGKGWSMVNDVDGKWLEGLGSVVKSVYVTAGKQEVFLDQSIKFAEMVRQRNPGLDIVFEEAEKEAHDFILLEAKMGIIGDATTRMRSWTAKVFG